MACLPCYDVMRSFVGQQTVHLSSRWSGILIGLAAGVAAALVRFAVTPLVGDSVPFVTFFPAVALGAWAAGVYGGGAAVKSGAGVGLFVCRRLVEAMGGEISVSRGAGGGACFRFSVPIVTEGAEVPAT